VCGIEQKDMTVSDLQRKFKLGTQDKKVWTRSVSHNHF